jgi:hypothetical protein
MALYYFDKYNKVVDYYTYSDEEIGDQVNLGLQGSNYNVSSRVYGGTYWSSSGGYGYYAWAPDATITVDVDNQGPESRYLVVSDTEMRNYVATWIGSPTSAVFVSYIPYTLTKTPTYEKGTNLLESNILAEEGTYPVDGEQGSYWYVRKGQLTAGIPTLL